MLARRRPHNGERRRTTASMGPPVKWLPPTRGCAQRRAADSHRRVAARPRDMGRDPPSGRRRGAAGQLPARRLGQRARGPHRSGAHPHVADAPYDPLRAWHRDTDGEPAPAARRRATRPSRVKRTSGWSTTRTRSSAPGFPLRAVCPRPHTRTSSTAMCSASWSATSRSWAGPVRRPATLLRWMNAYAAATASTASFETIRDAATGGEGQKPAKTTTQPYREILQRLFIVDELPAWAPTRNRISRLAMPSKAPSRRPRPRRQPARSERWRPAFRRAGGAALAA